MTKSMNSSDYEFDESKSQESLKEILDTSKNYEKLAFHRGIAGLYYRVAISMLLGALVLIILEVLNDGEIFYDKGLFGSATEFTVTQVGIILVFLLMIGDISFSFTRFITDQRYTEFLAQEDRAKMVKTFSLGSVIGGIIFAIPTIILASLDRIGEAQGWAIMGIFLSLLLLLLGKSTNHIPTVFYGSMVFLASIFIAFETIPGPYWLVLMMVLGSGGFITAIWSYLSAQNKF